MYSASARAVAQLPAYTDGCIIRRMRKVVVTTVRRPAVDSKPVIGQHMSNADLWRIINVGV